MQNRMILSGAGCFVCLLAVAGIAYSAKLSTTDKQFLTAVARADMTEANEGQIAENQATRDDVKNLGKTMVQDHTENYSRLTTLAAQAGVAIPKGINTGKDRTVQQLTHAKGASFDRMFAADEITSHKQALALFKREAAHGQDPEVKEFANKTIPVLEKHLQMAEACAKPAR